MHTVLFNIYQKILVVGVPKSKFNKQFRALEKRGAIYAEANSVRLSRDIPAGTEVVVMYKPVAVKPTKKDIELEGQLRLINELAGYRRIPCWSTPLLPSVLEFVSGRLSGPASNGSSKSAVIANHADLPDKDYVESRAPTGDMFNIKHWAARIKGMARADGRSIGYELVMKYLTRLRNDRRRSAKASIIRKPERVLKLPARVDRQALREAPVVELPEDLAKQAARPSPVKLNRYVASLFRADLPFSNESYANAIQKVAAKSCFPDANAVEICLIIIRLRERSGKNYGRGNELVLESSETQASA
jgi:hypothetical protein